MTSGGERVEFGARSEPVRRPRLTERQWEVLRVLFDRDGFWSETCRDLGITHNTLSVHLADISERLGLTSVRSLVIFKAVGWAKR